MKNRKYLCFLFIALSCACSQENPETPSSWIGEWDAQWRTDSSSFEGMDGITDYTMPGQVTFSNESVNIKAFGFEGCVFSRDTLDHSLSWKIKNDSLILINDEDTPGMVYQIKSSTEKEIQLQLMEDISLTLTR